MASLIAPLACGVRGAESGVAEIYVRGTTTAASVYSDKDAQTAVTTHSLDSNGGVVRYVKVPVDIIVKDAALATVRSFTWEDHAGAIEVTNAGFTGTLANGQTGAGGRTTLDAILTLFYGSLGAIDGEVLNGEAGVPIKDVVGASAAVFFNVKSTSYGAVGDGTTDDLNSIQAAINAAVAAGGGIVYFPPGTYLIGGQLSCTSAKVLFWSPTPGAAVIKQNTTATAGWMSLTADDVTVMGLGFSIADVTYTGTVIKTTSSNNLTLINCKFPGFSGTHVDAGSGSIKLSNCAHVINRVTGKFSTTSTGTVLFDSCTFSVTAASTAEMFDATNAAGKTIISGAVYTATAVATPILGSAGQYSIVGGVWTTLTGTGFNGSSSTTSSIVGAVVSGVVTIDADVEAGCYAPGMVTSETSSTRAGARLVTTCTGITQGFDPSYGIHEILHTSGATFELNAVAPQPTGGAYSQFMTIIYKNTTGGAITPTYHTTYWDGPALPAVNSGNAISFTAVYSGISGAQAGKWIIIGATPTAFTV